MASGTQLKSLLALGMLVSSACKLTQTQGSSLLLDAQATSPFYLPKMTNAGNDLAAMRAASDPDANLMQTIADSSVAVWYVGGDANSVGARVKQQADGANAAAKTAVMVAYNIPNRDCGSFSAGGAQASTYQQWIDAFAAGIGSAKAIIILEPDAIAQTDCLNEAQRTERYSLLSAAVKRLKQAPNARVYIDAGHANWLAADEAGKRLQASGVADADGFSLNVSNFIADDVSITYGQRIRAIVAKNFVIDSSRNGNGPTSGNDWCNPSGRAIGRAPTMPTPTPGLDALIWIKLPGESDGSCNGGPAAGQFSRSIALELARNAHGNPNQQSPLPTQQGPQPPPAPLPSAPSTPGSSAPSPSQSPSSGPSPAPTSGSLLVSLKAKSQWDYGYCADVIVTNQGQTAISNWSIVLVKNGATIDQAWNLTTLDQGATLLIKPLAGLNSAIAPGQSYSMQGFCTNHSKPQVNIVTAGSVNSQ